MPIRFQCPNGHKLQVGDELAGKRGACPECGAKVVVPGAAKPPAAMAGEKPAAQPDGPPEKQSGASPDHKPDDKPAAKPVARPVAKAVAKAPAAAGDAWYLRTTTGEQFGPAAAEQFADWIRQQRVGPTSYVWHEGWPEWRLAADVADQLPAPLVGVAADGGASAGPAGFASPPAKRSASTRYLQKKRMWIRLRLVAAAALLLLTLVLAGVLIWVLVVLPGQGATEPADDGPPAAAQEEGGAEEDMGEPMPDPMPDETAEPMDERMEMEDAAEADEVMPRQGGDESL